MTDTSLYDRDFYTWTREQAAALRQAAETRVNLPIDWEAVAEEIEDLGKAQRRTLKSLIDQAMRHLLLLQHARAVEPRRGWCDELDEFRRQIHDTLAESPGLRPHLPTLAEAAWRDARKQTGKKLQRYEGMDPDSLPADCPYTLDEILDEDWYPAAVRPNDRGA